VSGQGGAQLVLSLGHRPAADRRSFLVTDANRLAVETLDSPHAWAGGRLVLTGGEGAGKSHLAAIFLAERGGAEARDLVLPDGAGPVLVEDADRLGTEAERPLLHLLNAAADGGRSVLLTARTPPARWPVALPDLASRLAASAVARIGPPDDALLSWLLVKVAADRQLALGPRVVEHLLKRMDRSHAAPGRVVAALDEASLSERRAITTALATAVLARLARE